MDLKILNGIKLILGDQGYHLDSYTIPVSIQSVWNHSGPSEVPYNWSGTFFAVSRKTNSEFALLNSTDGYTNFRFSVNNVHFR